jgi:electron transport complex protein RnfG
MKGNAKEIWKPTLVLVLICFVVTACLAATNAATKGSIAAQAEKDAQESRLVALPEAGSFEKSNAKLVSNKVIDCYEGKKGGQPIGWVITTKTASYGGDITVMTGIKKSGKVSGVVLTNTSDTPGLGLNAKKASFRDQYKQQVPANGFEVVKNGKAGNGKINAMTGATISSKAVTEAVNNAIAEYKQVKGGA